MKTNEEYLNQMFQFLDSLDHIKTEDIPNIDLYMDQVTTFMEKHLEHMKRYPDDKILTKTMINNYAKNNLLPSPVRKKYTQEHILLLVFIYYFKNVLNFTDIETIFSYLTEHHFGETAVPLSDVYTEVFSLERAQMERLKNDLKEKFKDAEGSFPDLEEADQKPLQLFAFICELAFDVYLKKAVIERLVDTIREERPEKPGHKKK